MDIRVGPATGFEFLRHPAVNSTLPRDIDTNRGDRGRTHCPRIVAMFPSSPCAPTYGWLSSPSALSPII